MAIKDPLSMYTINLVSAAVNGHFNGFWLINGFLKHF